MYSKHYIRNYNLYAGTAIFEHNIGHCKQPKMRKSSLITNAKNRLKSCYYLSLTNKQFMVGPQEEKIVQVLFLQIMSVVSKTVCYHPALGNASGWNAVDLSSQQVQNWVLFLDTFLIPPLHWADQEISWFSSTEFSQLC